MPIDELEEKPEISTKSPIILKDEKPPLLPHYNGLNNHDGKWNHSFAEFFILIIIHF